MNYSSIKITKFEGGIKNASKPKFIPIGEALEEIETGKYADFIKFLRTFMKSDQEEDKRAYNKEKGNLDYYCFMCRCTYRNVQSVTREDVTPFFIADLDDIDQLQLSVIKSELRSDPHVYSFFESPSGEGLKVLYVYDQTKYSVVDIYYTIEERMKKVYSVVIDKSGKDVTRACYTSHDEEIYINEKATPISCRKITIPDNSKMDIVRSSDTPFKEFRKCVEHIGANGINVTKDYDDWRYVGQIIAGNYGEKGRESWHEISATDKRYNYKESDRKYNNFLKTTRKRIDLSWLFAKAKFNGHDKKKMKHHIVADVIRGEKIYYNEVTNKMEWKGGEEFTDRDLNTIFFKLGERGIDKVTKTLLEQIINSHYVESKHKPLEFYHELLEKFKESDLDEIDRLIDHFTFDLSDHETSKEAKDNQLFYEFCIRRWLFQFPAVLHGKVPELCLVLTGPQGNGKTELFNRMLYGVMRQYYSTDKLDTNSKDDLIALAENWCILDDEFSGKSKKEAGHWKSVLSKRMVKVRKPYARNPETMPRLAVLCGTSNDKDVIYDRTGNRRILAIPMLERDFIKFDAIDKEKLWRGIFGYWDNNRDSHKLTKSEAEYLNKDSEAFTVINIERDLLQKYFEETDRSDGEWYTSTDLAVYISKDNPIRINPYTIGRECQQLGWKRKRIPGASGKKGYYLAERKSTITAP